MSGLYLHNDKPSSIAGAYYFRQYELKRIYSRNFYTGLSLALIVHAVIVFLLIVYAPVYEKAPKISSVLLPPVGVHFNVMQVHIVGEESAGMDVSGSGGGEGTVRQNPGAAFGNLAAVPNANPRNTITPSASIVPRSLQGPGMNDIVGISRSPATFDTVQGYHGRSQSGIGSGGGTGTTVGSDSGAGSGLTGTPGFGGGFGNKFVPGNPGNNSATGTPYRIVWNGVSRALLRGNRPQFPPGVQNGGTVKIRIIVDPAGDVVSMIPIEKADSRFDEAAMAAIRTWRFSKLSANYPRVNQTAVATFIFKLE